ncbi:MAG: FAD/NAD(P)-binding oxidoreductase, partial [Pseudomonadota bacterium]
AIRRMPHAWKAGAQTVLLRQQLREMEDGGTVVMSVPPAPYRCPPGPYERASLIANYLKREKPRSKLVVLDAKDGFSKKPLFLEAWSERYPDHLEWRGASDDGRVSRVDPETLTFETDFDTVQADVANVIPPQKASQIADRAGVTDATGWCPVDPVTFESTRQPNIHVIGDAAIMAPMPKSAFAANAQGKVCAIQVARLLAGQAPQPTVLANTCYSYVGAEAAVSVVGVYRLGETAISEVSDAGGISPLASLTSLIARPKQPRPTIGLARSHRKHLADALGGALGLCNARDCRLRHRRADADSGSTHRGRCDPCPVDPDCGGPAARSSRVSRP